jgi:hypothetical protein
MAGSATCGRASLARARGSCASAARLDRASRGRPLPFALPLYRSVVRGEAGGTARLQFDRLLAWDRNVGVPAAPDSGGRVVSRADRPLQGWPSRSDWRGGLVRLHPAGGGSADAGLGHRRCRARSGARQRQATAPHRQGRVVGIRATDRRTGGPSTSPRRSRSTPLPAASMFAFRFRKPRPTPRLIA